MGDSSLEEILAKTRARIAAITGNAGASCPQASAPAQASGYRSHKRSPSPGPSRSPAPSQSRCPCPQGASSTSREPLPTRSRPPNQAQLPSPVPYIGEAGGAVRRKPRSTQRQPRSPPREPLLSLSPDRGPDPATMAHLQRVYTLSKQPICPGSKARPPSPLPGQDPLHYDRIDPAWAQFKGPRSTRVQRRVEPERMDARGQFPDAPNEFYPQRSAGQYCTAPEVVEELDLYFSRTPEPTQSSPTSYYETLSEFVETEDPSAEDLMNKARARAALRMGLDPSTAHLDEMLCDDEEQEGEGPSLDEILAGAPPLPPATDEYGGYDEYTSQEDQSEDDGLLHDIDVNFLTSDAFEDVEDVEVFGEQPTHDPFGLPTRQYPHAEKMRQERLRAQQAMRLRKQQEEVARVRAEQEAAKAAAEEAARAAAAAAAQGKAGRAGGRSTTRGAPPGRDAGRAQSRSRPVSARPPTAQTCPSSGRPPGIKPRAASGPPQGATAAQPKARQTPFQAAKEAKAAAFQAAKEKTKARTSYQPPKLRSRPPSRPTTVPKGPKCLEKKKDDKPDPSRDMLEYPESEYVDMSQVKWVVPKKRKIPDLGPISVPPELLAEVTGIINETRNKLNDTLNRYR